MGEEGSSWEESAEGDMVAREILLRIQNGIGNGGETENGRAEQSSAESKRKRGGGKGNIGSGLVGPTVIPLSVNNSLPSRASAPTAAEEVCQSRPAQTRNYRGERVLHPGIWVPRLS